MIKVENLTKRFRKDGRPAVDNVSFTARPGEVTGFLGLNGAGKSTTMRMIVGLDTPTSGSATINGSRYDTMTDPSRVSGSLLDPTWPDPKVTVNDYLGWVIQATGANPDDVYKIVDTVGLTSERRKKIGDLSLGRRQRLGIAVSLVNDPDVFVLDEPTNGLDPESARWVRDLYKKLAHKGNKTVLISSHLLNELQDIMDRIVVIDQGRIIADAPFDSFLEEYGSGNVKLTIPTEKLADFDMGVCAFADKFGVDPIIDVISEGSGYSNLNMSGMSAVAIGKVAVVTDTPVVEMRRQSVEDAFLELVTASRRDV